ncbi:hypothetical protein ACFC4G_46715 [Streptomyces sp. NPDC056002]|uniref:hypothetical protein n=1 Tax=Streptomyces sp. NPDC056002 TaxID=3345675 RepID=UPI0035D9F45B
MPVLPPPRRTPDTEAARQALLQALRHLDSHNDPQALDRARKAAQKAAEAIPYRWEQPYCAEYRRIMAVDTCRQLNCTRCAAYQAGDPMPLTGW